MGTTIGIIILSILGGLVIGFIIAFLVIRHYTKPVADVFTEFIDDFIKNRIG